jgi:hypothetical protein
VSTPVTDADQAAAQAWAQTIQPGDRIRKAPRGVPWAVAVIASNHRTLHLVRRTRRTQWKSITGAALVAAHKATIAEPVMPGER